MSAIPGKPLRRERDGTDSSESDSDSDVELSNDFFGVENIMKFLDEAENLKPVVKTRKKRGNGRWDNCTWSDILSDLTYRDPSHYNGKTFRRRFRVPYSIFEKIVSICEETKSFEDDGAKVLRMMVLTGFLGVVRTAAIKARYLYPCLYWDV